MAELARVINIDGDFPLPSDKLLIDSQILVWLCYGRSRSGVAERAVYEKYIKASLEIGASIWHCPLQLSEIVSTIEKNELELENAARYTRHQGSLNKKQYRDVQANRDNVCTHAETSWETVKQFAPQCAGLALCSDESNRALGRLRSERLDVYDIYLLECMGQENISMILSADRDFVWANNITLLTAKESVLEIAEKEKRLLSSRTKAEQTAAMQATISPN